MIAILNYDEQAKRHALEHSLNKELKDALILQAASKPPLMTKPSCSLSLEQTDWTTAWVPAPKNSGAQTPSDLRPPNQPGPMELNTNRRHTTPAERQRRIAQGLRMYCG